MADTSVLDLFGAVLAHAKTEYDDLSATWRDIERKAQGIFTSAGIFIGAISFAAKEPTGIDAGLLWLVYLAFALLLISCALALSVLFVRDVQAIEDVGEVRNELSRILPTAGAVIPEDKHRAFLMARITYWNEVNENLHNDNLRKSTRLLQAQKCLFAGFLVGAFTIARVLFGGNSYNQPLERTPPRYALRRRSTAR